MPRESNRPTKTNYQDYLFDFSDIDFSQGAARPAEPAATGQATPLPAPPQAAPQQPDSLPTSARQPEASPVLPPAEPVIIPPELAGLSRPKRAGTQPDTAEEKTPLTYGGKPLSYPPIGDAKRENTADAILSGAAERAKAKGRQEMLAAVEDMQRERESVGVTHDALWQRITDEMLPYASEAGQEEAARTGAAPAQDRESKKVLCFNRLFTLSQFVKLEIPTQTNKRTMKRVNSHKNAILTPKGREEMVRRLDSMPAAVVAAGFGVSLRTVRKWKSRYRQGGVEALVDRSSRPLRCRIKLTEEDYGEIFSLRQKRLTGDAIAARLGRSRSSVFRALRKLGCSRLASLEVKPPVRRYQWEKPGQMLHLDIKRLGKIDGVGHRKAGTRQVCRRRPGWEYLHVCVDEASRMAYTAILPDETAESAVVPSPGIRRAA